MMSQALERCDNCRITIGLMGKACIWNDRVVCSECYERLSQASAYGKQESKQTKATRKPRIIFLAAILAIAIVTTYYYTNLLTGKPYAPTEQSSAKIEGGAWMVRKGGTSDLLRGMTVLLIKPTVSASEIGTIYQNKIEQITQAIVDSKLSLELSQTQLKIAQLNSDPAAMVQKQNEVIDINSDIQVKQANLNAIKIKYAHPSGGADLLKEYQLIGPKIPLADNSCVYVETHVDGEGKYHFDNIPKGKYLIYAYADFRNASVGFIEWLLPIEIKNGELIKLDLFNENATSIK